MKFLTYDNDDPRSVIEEKYKLYSDYLTANRQNFPSEAYEFATAEWHYDPADHRCPHDSWVEQLTITESQQDSASKNRSIGMQLVLLGAYHDGKLRIGYEGVKSYNLNLLPDSVSESKSHGDWLIDEIRLLDNRWLVHEINFWRDGSWRIECQNIKCEWLPK
jgi:hypothetical protein